MRPDSVTNAPPAIVRPWNSRPSGWAGSGIRKRGTASTPWSRRAPRATRRTRCCCSSTTPVLTLGRNADTANIRVSAGCARGTRHPDAAGGTGRRGDLSRSRSAGRVSHRAAGGRWAPAAAVRACPGAGHGRYRDAATASPPSGATDTRAAGWTRSAWRAAPQAGRPRPARREGRHLSRHRAQRDHRSRRLRAHRRPAA